MTSSPNDVLMPDYAPHRSAHGMFFTVATSIAAVTLVAATLVGQTSSSTDVQAILQRQTQELMDAVAAGDHGPWTRYLHDQMFYAAEDGTTKSKAQLLDELRPLPKNIWGKLRVTRFRAIVHGGTAVTNYVAEEDEGYFGQTLHELARQESPKWRAPGGEGVSQAMRDRGNAFAAATGEDARCVRRTARC